MGTPTAQAQQAPTVYRYFFNVGSVDSFERKMEDAQEDLGWSPDSYVPIVYTNELSWQQVGPWLALICRQNLSQALLVKALCSSCLATCAMAHKPSGRCSGTAADLR